jgi:hypothetical protein
VNKYGQKVIIWSGAVLFALGWALSVVAQPIHPVNVAGEWRQVTVNGPFSWKQDPQCQVYGWTERTLNLFRVPGSSTELRGQWSKRFSGIWVSNLQGRCRWEQETHLQPFADASVTFSLTSKLLSNRAELNITADFTGCRGLLCPDFASYSIQENSQSFTLKFDAGRLIDTGSSREEVIFERTADGESQLMEATDVFGSFIQSMTGEGVTTALHRFASAVLVPSYDQTLRVQAQVGKIVPRVCYISLLSTDVWLHPTDHSPYAFFVEFLQNEKGQSVTEYIVLKRESNGWKLVSLVYG